MSKNILETTKKRMKDLQDNKTKELLDLQMQLDDARKKAAEADKAMNAAMERTDLEAYAQAKDDLRHSKIAGEMYQKRYDQLKRNEYMSEAESDEVIDSLLEYEKELDANVDVELAKLLKPVADLITGYRAALQDVENTIREWTARIHANYKNRGGASYVDPLTGERTDRSPSPIPVHMVGYDGSKVAYLVYTTLKDKDIEAILSED